MSISTGFFICRALFSNYLILYEDYFNHTESATPLFFGILADHLYDGFLMFLSKKNSKINKIDGYFVILKIILYCHTIIFSFHFEKFMFIISSLTSLVGSFIFILEQEVGIEDISQTIEKKINHLSIHINNDIKYNTECPICLEDFESNTSDRRLMCKLPCGHSYHYRCISEYMKVSQNCGCAVCRQPF